MEMESRAVTTIRLLIYSPRPDHVRRRVVNSGLQLFVTRLHAPNPPCWRRSTVVRKLPILSGVEGEFFSQPALSNLKTEGLSKNLKVNTLGNVRHSQQCSTFYSVSFSVFLNL